MIFDTAKDVLKSYFMNHGIASQGLTEALDELSEDTCQELLFYAIKNMAVVSSKELAQMVMNHR